MEIPNAVKGYFYPSSRANRCPSFHRCTLTNKCQSFDRHALACQLCELRTNAHDVDSDSVPIGGYLPEGEFYPDLQDAIGNLERMIGKPFAHPDQEAQHINTADIARRHEREARVVDTIRAFTSLGSLQMEEKIMQAMVDPELAALLGRLE